YAIGVSFANYLKTSIEKPSEIGIDLNKDLVLKGIEHVFAGNPEMSEEETRAALEPLDKRVAETMQVKAAEKAAENKKKGDEFR
ncbi:FKBP-type peptidyl-prolyl cis-trans isomerase N-terminal domain-containing protein, partial [Vibrio parahaemolyticus]|uniref:FKBP-type peptidyl-prolyl cis-trans isomerase N-terminal domain-containing protein n=1 Tax=Vibrio parahaemolyticus TaxID=670 RepID=UPI001A907B44